MNTKNQKSTTETTSSQCGVISIWLRINHTLFAWYYKRVPKHFHDWSFIKSVKILISNYEHRDLLFRNELEGKKALIKENNDLRAEISQMRIEKIASSSQIRGINKMFGTNWTPADEN